MNDSCFICHKNLNIANIFLCEEHSIAIKKNYDLREKIIEKPTEKEHCYLCGEWTNREMIIFDNWCYVCNVCLNDTINAYKL